MAPRNNVIDTPEEVLDAIDDFIEDLADDGFINDSNDTRAGKNVNHFGRFGLALILLALWYFTLEYMA